MITKRKVHGPVRYQIEVQGQLDGQWSDWFEGTMLSGRKGRTILISSVVDQSGLHGLLARIRDLGLPLVEVKRIKPGSEKLPEKRCGDE